MKTIDIIFSSERYKIENLVSGMKFIGYDILQDNDINNISIEVAPGIQDIRLEFADSISASAFLEKFYENYYTSVGDHSIDFSMLYLNTDDNELLAKIAHLHGYAVSNIVLAQDQVIGELNTGMEMLVKRVKSLEDCINRNSVNNLRIVIKTMVDFMESEGYIDGKQTMEKLFPVTH